MNHHTSNKRGGKSQLMDKHGRNNILAVFYKDRFLIFTSTLAEFYMFEPSAVTAKYIKCPI